METGRTALLRGTGVPRKERHLQTLDSKSQRPWPDPPGPRPQALCHACSLWINGFTSLKDQTRNQPSNSRRGAHRHSTAL